jgi:hypothetical protein
MSALGTPRRARPHESESRLDNMTSALRLLKTHHDVDCRNVHSDSHLALDTVLLTVDV